jgi:hypothetical protein
LHKAESGNDTNSEQTPLTSLVQRENTFQALYKSKMLEKNINEENKEGNVDLAQPRENL